MQQARDPRVADLVKAGGLRVGLGLGSLATVLLALAAQLPGSQVLEDGFGVISYAALVPKGHAGRLAYVSEFIEEAKVLGFVKQIIERHGLRGVGVAPPAKPN